MPLGWPGRKADALRRAIGAVQHVETDSTHIPAPVDTTMVLRAWQATSATCSEEKVRRLPRDERDGELATSTPTSMPARTSSTVIRVAKFGTSSGVRARAFYLEWGTPLTVKFAVGTLRARSRLRREVSVRQIGRAHV